MRARYEEEVKQSEAFWEALADQTDLIKHLRPEILQTLRARHATQEKSTREIAGILKQMDDAGDRLEAGCDRLLASLRKAKNRKSQYEMTCLHVQGKLRCVLEQVAGFMSNRADAVPLI